MKTDVNKLYTKSNIIMLMVGFLTPIVLFSALAASLYNKTAEIKPSACETATIENVAISTEMYAAPKAYIYEKAEVEEADEEDENVTISLNADKICYRDALLINFVRR